MSTVSTDIRTLARETDTALAALTNELWTVRDRRATAAKYADKYADYAAEVVASDARIAEIKAEIVGLELIWEANGRWSRAFVVPLGHVHSTMSCHTCFPTTRFWWNTDYSAATEAQIVEAAGDRACTICFPSAPVDRPSTMFTPDEIAAKADQIAKATLKAERAAAKAAKAPTADGSPLVVPSDSGRYTMAIQTEITARQEWNRAEEWAGYTTNTERLAFYADRQDRIEVALAGKHGISAPEMRSQLKIKYAKRAR